jgi:hypothetical protein
MRAKLFPVLAIFLFIASGCTVTDQDMVRGSFATALSGVRISSPALENVGIHSQAQTLVIANPTGMPATLFAFGKEIAEIFPGERVFAQKHYEPFWQSSVSLVLLFRGEDGNYACSAGRVLGTGAYAQSVSWVVRPDEISCFGKRPPSSRPDVYERKSSQIRFPRETWGATSWFEAVNDTPFVMGVSVNGHNAGEYKSGTLYSLSARTLDYGSYGRSVLIQLSFYDSEGLLVGDREFRFYPAQQGVYSEQHIVTPASLRR